MAKSNFVILNGFDRSGSSAISRTLATHQDIELIMQPFNSGFMRKGKHRPLEQSPYLEQAVSFFDDLEKNNLNDKLIFSHWHKEYSTTEEYIPGKIHLVKTTMNHLAQRFMKHRYPAIDVWGIWRDPNEIIHSLRRNEFDKVWYKDALSNLEKTVAEEDILNPFKGFFSDQLSPSQQLALILAVHSYFFFYFLDNNKLLQYDNFLINPKKCLMPFFHLYDLSPLDPGEKASEDLNITGEVFSKGTKIKLEEKIQEEIEPILRPLLDLMLSKFEIKRK